MRKWLWGLALGMGLLAASPAHAQYKNSAFSLDLGYAFITKPSLTDGQGNALSDVKIPVHLDHGYRLGGEIAFKLRSDHWWFTGRIDGAILSYNPGSDPANSYAQSYDQGAQDSIGTLLGLEGVAGVRYYFLTDHFRPYLQGAVSYMHLFSFTNQNDATCALTACDGGSYGDNFLPHTNIFGVHVQPGVEFILQRDLALTFAVDIQRWLIINADGNWVVTPSVGVSFYG